MNRWQVATGRRRVALIRPGVNRWRLYRWYAPLCSHEAPLGLLYIAGNLLKHNFEVSIVDGEQIGNRAVIARMRELQPEVIGLTATTFSFDQAAALVRSIRSILPNSLIVMGGPHVSALPHETMSELPELDGCVVGEGEEAMLELASGAAPEQIAGLVWRTNDGEFRINPAREFACILDDYQPSWQLLDNFPIWYQPGFQDRNLGRSISLVASRGCSYNCSFCAGPGIHGNRRRSHSPEYVVTTMMTLASQYGISNFYFHDDNFTQDKDWLAEFCNRLELASTKLRWSCASRVEPLSRPILDQMRRAGCTQLGIGVESSSDRILQWLNKSTTFGTVRQTLREIHAAGIETKLYLIIGTPIETITELAATLRHILQVGAAHIQMIYFTPLPGTADAVRNEAGRRMWQRMNLLNPISISRSRGHFLRLVELCFYGCFYTSKSLSLLRTSVQSAMSRGFLL